MANLTQADLENMSDEDLLNFDPSQLAFNSSAATEEEAEVEEETTEEVVEESNDDDATAEEVDDEAEPAEEATEVVDVKTDESKDTPKADKPETKADDKVDAARVVDTSTNVQEFYNKITAPFKANGRDMKVDTAEDAIQLMQMGANYHKKMASLKPSLQLVKMLENAGLNDESKLSFLIDVAAKKPEAISKLVQDSGIDPLDISPEKAGDYKPTSYKVSEQSLVLDEVLDNLKGSPHYAKTLNVVASDLDEASRQMVVDNPTILNSLHQHIQDGVFDQVWGKVEKERTFNRLTGLSDLEAYRQVGDAMAASGELKLPESKATPPSQVTPPVQVIVESKPKQADDSDRRKKRQAASPTKAATPSTKATLTVNPLSMSDEELMKQFSKF